MGRGEGQELLWGSRTRGDNGQRAPAWLWPHQHPVFTHPTSPYLLSVRQSLSPQARILFWASMCVMALVLSPSMYSTQSPTPTPAWAAFPPGVSYRTQRVRGSWPAWQRDDLSPREPATRSARHRTPKDTPHGASSRFRTACSMVLQQCGVRAAPG